MCECEVIDNFMVRISEGQVRYLVSCDLLISRFPTFITSLYHNPLSKIQNINVVLSNPQLTDTLTVTSHTIPSYAAELEIQIISQSLIYILTFSL